MSVQTTAPSPSPIQSRPSWPRHLLIGVGVLALLLLGTAAGILISSAGLPGSVGGVATPAADSVDVGFAQDMTVHHEQAVQMASWERDHTADPRLRQLAFDIESGQGRQIGHMQGWLALWGAAALPNGPHMRWMSGDSHMAMDAGVARMPGMATEDELRQLRASTGAALDTLFLQLMLRHHEGGTGMMSYAAQHATVPDVRTLAGQMLTSQTVEAQYMRQLIAAHGAAPLPLAG